MTSIDDADSGYMSYMLRIWRKRDVQGRAVWCASLQEPGSRRTESFRDVSALFSFLQGRMDFDNAGERVQVEPQVEGRWEEQG